jgi:hypothetical protein
MRPFSRSKAGVPGLALVHLLTGDTWLEPPLPLWGVKSTHLNFSLGRHLRGAMRPKSLKYTTRI